MTTRIDEKPRGVWLVSSIVGSERSRIVVENLQEPEEARENGVRAFGGLLSAQLQRLEELRATIPVEERNNPLPVVHEARPLVRRSPSPKATPEQIIRELAILDIVFSSQALTEEERAIRYQVYCHDLSGVSEAKLKAACELIRKDPTIKFFPTPGQILEVAEKRVVG